MIFTVCVLLASTWTGATEPLSEVDFAAPRPADLPSDQALQNEGAVIGRVLYERRGVFASTEDLSWVFATANKLHKTTRQSVIASQLLFAPGDVFDPRELQESERILRSNQFLFDAAVVPVAYENGRVDVKVTTRDLWSIEPALSWSRSGGENQVVIGIEDENFLGTGALIGALYERDLDRRSRQIYFSDRQVGRRWLSVFGNLSDNSDGHRYVFGIGRPFFALDTRRAWGVTLVDNDRVDSLYRLGDELVDYRHDETFADVWAGWSRGLIDGWVKRWRVGMVANDNEFALPPEGIRAGLVPPNRNLVYPYVSIDVVEDNFIKAANVQQMARTEDFFLGARYGATIGYAGTSLGADRSAWILRANAQRGFGSAQKRMLLLDGATSTRIESGSTRNSLLSVRARYFHRISPKWLRSIGVRATKGSQLDLDRPLQLGGDTGLRGYPVRYQSGDSFVLLSAEQRYFTDWYPWQLFRVGAAAFADAGRSFGDNPIGGESLGWLRSVGVGLRLAPTRGGRKVFHIDLAFPLDGDPSINTVQFSVQGKRSF
ncbi:MAG: POTRA domain-containing protein [Gammaproteobacteria bacterium]